MGAFLHGKEYELCVGARDNTKHGNTTGLSYSETEIAAKSPACQLIIGAYLKISWMIEN